jgi:hypothetical protein
MYPPQNITHDVSRAYGANYGRLAALKVKFDPGNLLRMNQNVRPVQ